MTSDVLKMDSRNVLFSSRACAERHSAGNKSVTIARFRGSASEVRLRKRHDDSGDRSSQEEHSSSVGGNCIDCCCCVCIESPKMKMPKSSKRGVSHSSTATTTTTNHSQGRPQIEESAVVGQEKCLICRGMDCPNAIICHDRYNLRRDYDRRRDGRRRSNESKGPLATTSHAATTIDDCRGGGDGGDDMAYPNQFHEQQKQQKHCRRQRQSANVEGEEQHQPKADSFDKSGGGGGSAAISRSRIPSRFTPREWLEHDDIRWTSIVPPIGAALVKSLLWFVVLSFIINCTILTPLQRTAVGVSANEMRADRNMSRPETGGELGSVGISLGATEHR